MNQEIDQKESSKDINVSIYEEATNAIGLTINNESSKESNVSQPELKISCTRCGEYLSSDNVTIENHMQYCNSTKNQTCNSSQKQRFKKCIYPRCDLKFYHHKSLLRHCERDHSDLTLTCQEKSCSIFLQEASESQQDLEGQQNTCVSAFGRIRKKNPKYDEIDQINCAFKIQNDRKKQNNYEKKISIDSSSTDGYSNESILRKKSLIKVHHESLSLLETKRKKYLTVQTTKSNENKANLSKLNVINKKKQLSVAVHSNSEESPESQTTLKISKSLGNSSEQFSVLNIKEELIKIISLDSSNQALDYCNFNSSTYSKNETSITEDNNGIFIANDPNEEKAAQHSVILIVSSSDENAEKKYLSENCNVNEGTEEPHKKKQRIEIKPESYDSVDNDPEFRITSKDLNPYSSYYTKKKRKWSRTCKGCGEVFSRLKNFNIHKYECKEETKLNVNWKLKSSMLPCPTCGVDVHKGKGKYKTHIKRCAVDLPGKKTFCLHPSCELRFYHVHWMLQHVKKVHTDMIVDVRNLRFKTMEDFKIWKEEEEARTLTYFNKSTGFKTKNVKEGEAKSFYYNCQHNGDSRPHSKNKQRLTDKRWQKGSSKLGFCPARMNLKKLFNGEIRLYYIASHSHEVGKLENTSHQPLPEDVERYIIQELKHETPMTEIQDTLMRGVLLDTWDSVCEEKRSIIRRHIVSLAQIKKRKDKLNLGVEGLPHLDKADCERLSRLMKSLESQKFSPVITYKPQGAPLVIGALELDELPFSNELFALGLQSKQQFDVMCQQLSHINVICVDTVYSKRSLEFYLFTIMLPDGQGNGKGNPVAHFVTNQRDEITLRYLFSSLKERFPRLKLDAIITDDTLSGQKCYTALCSVFGEARRLLCHSFIKKRWRWKIKLFAKGNITLKNEIMVYLEAILGELNEEFFNQLCFSFVEKYNEVCPQICEYFSQWYLNRTEMWGKCHRLSLGSHIDCIPYSHLLHDKLRISYKNYNRKSRICDLTELLLDIETSLDLNVKMEGGMETTIGEESQVDISVADPEESLQYEPIVESFLDIQQPVNHHEEVAALEELVSDLDSVKFLLQQHQPQQAEVGFSAHRHQLLQHLSSDIKVWMQQWHQSSAAITISPNTGQQNTTLITNMAQNMDPEPVDTDTNTQIISVADASMHFVDAMDEGSAGYIVSNDSKTQFALHERGYNVQPPYIVTASMAHSVKESEIAVRNLITNIPY